MGDWRFEPTANNRSTAGARGAPGHTSGRGGGLTVFRITVMDGRSWVIGDW